MCCVCVYVMCVVCAWCAWCVCVCVCVCVSSFCLSVRSTQTPVFLYSDMVTCKSHSGDGSLVCACVSHSVCVAEVPNSSSVHPPTHTHSPLPLPTPAEGTQGQVSWYKQLLPGVQGRSKGEGPYVCAKRGTLPVSWKGQWHATAMHTLTHTVTTCTQHTHTQLTTHIYLHACSMANKIVFISD